MRYVESQSQSDTALASKNSIDFKIGDISKIIEILRNKMYSNPIQTLVQEYLANARDACRETGNPRIDVWLPTHDDPTLRIRDYGPGINSERMLNNFTQYGSSTKTRTNAQNGGFGLGSKLAWAYTDQFSILTYIDGTLTEYLAHINGNKNGTLDLVSESSASEPNGTVIRVPVENCPSDIDAFTKAVFRATFFWNDSEKPNIVNAPEPKH